MLYRYHKVLKFLLSGGTAAAVEYAVFLTLHKVGMWLLLANALSFMCGLVVSFTLNKHWVFSHKGAATRQFIMYLTLALANLCISSGLIYLLVHSVELPAQLAKLCVMALVACWNYVIFRNIIFKKTGNL
jgi:putative flippase GtrA